MAKANESTRPRSVDADAAVQAATAILHRVNSEVGKAEAELHAAATPTAEQVLAAIADGQTPETMIPARSGLRQRVEVLRQAATKAAADVAAARLRAEEAILAERAGELAAADEVVGVALAELDKAIQNQRAARDAVTRSGCDWQRVSRRQKQLKYLRPNSIHLEATQWANGGQR